MSKNTEFGLNYINIFYPIRVLGEARSDLNSTLSYPLNYDAPFLSGFFCFRCQTKNDVLFPACQ